MPDFVHLISMSYVDAPHTIHHIPIVVWRSFLHHHPYLGLVSAAVPQLTSIKKQATLGNVNEIASMILFNSQFPLLQMTVVEIIRGYLCVEDIPPKYSCNR